MTTEGPFEMHQDNPDVSPYHQNTHSSLCGLTTEQPVATGTKAARSATVQPRLQATYHKEPGVLRCLLFAGLARLQDPQPEGPHTRGINKSAL